MANICKCDKCDSEGARHFGGGYDRPGSAQGGEKFSFDLCEKCADEIMAPIRKIKNLIGGRMMAAQTAQGPARFTI